MQMSKTVPLINKLIFKSLTPDLFAVSLSVQTIVLLHLVIQFCSLSKKKLVFILQHFMSMPKTILYAFHES